ncbi:MAG: hypothetical protein DMG89_00805 [Acidobacteria bacterium]|nr:MAG: hypothetical protein DMG89_00805 [Acidobacteriota bacterium]
MRYQEQEIVLHTEARYGKRLPLDFCGAVCRQLAPMMLGSVRMAIEGTSSHLGAAPLWLRQASDVRLVGISERGQGDTALHLEAPPLGEAAEELYKQQTLWETKPAPQDTAVNILARVMRDVRTGDPESPLYDLPLLKHLSHIHRLFRHSLIAMEMPQNSKPEYGFTRVDEQVALKALELSERTPAPRPVRVSGHLDMIRHSTRSFELLLEERRPVRGVLEDATAMDTLKSLLGFRVLVVGKAVYRPSGSLLRIDAHGVASGQGESKLFEKVPGPVEKRPAPVRYKPGEQARRGVPGFFGKWPGEETDEQLLAMLKELSE